MLRRLLGPALSLVVLGSSGHASAQDAQALFDDGLANMKAGRYKIGCALIKRSLDVDSRPGTVFTLAECYSRAGKFASAVSYYDRFLVEYETMPLEQKLQQQARAEISRTERTRLVAQVAWLTVTLPSPAPPGVAVTLDGEEFNSGLFGVPTAVDPGPHVFTTHAPESPLIEQRIDIAPGERKQALLEVRVGGWQPPVQVPDPMVDEPPPAHSVNPWIYVTAGVGAAGLVTGGIAGSLLLRDRTTIRKDCPDHQCSPAGLEAVDRAQNTLAPITTVGFSVAAAGALATVILLVTDHPRATDGTQPAAYVPTLGLAPGQASLHFRGAF